MLFYWLYKNRFEDTVRSSMRSYFLHFLAYKNLMSYGKSKLAYKSLSWDVFVNKCGVWSRDFAIGNVKIFWTWRCNSRDDSDSPTSKTCVSCYVQNFHPIFRTCDSHRIRKCTFSYWWYTLTVFFLFRNATEFDVQTEGKMKNQEEEVVLRHYLQHISPNWAHLQPFDLGSDGSSM
jgi:hypothetical protein